MNQLVRLSGCAKVLVMVMPLCLGSLSCAGPLRQEERGSRAARPSLAMEGDEAVSAAALPAGIQVVRDVAYGPDARQRMDLYLPAHPDRAPVIFMIHGGAWRLGDKGSASVVDNKVARWVTKGFIFVSVNYRLLPDTAVRDQAGDIVRALAVAQENVPAWGGDADKFVVMGHSAGAHLAALLAAAPGNAYPSGVRPWLGTVLLDSAVLDVVNKMESRHVGLYDRAFGREPAYWYELSPLQHLSPSAKPLLVVCSLQRLDSCRQAHLFAERAATLKVPAPVLEQDLSHSEINRELGRPGRYTDAVESFMASLDGRVRQLLLNPPGASE